MKILTTIILCALCGIQAVAQNEPENIYTFDDRGEMVINEKFIDTHVERNDSEVKPYELIGISTFEAHSKKYELQVLEYNGWKDEAGDFRIIRLFHNDKLILEFIDEEGWIGNPLIKDEKTWIGGPSRDIDSGYYRHFRKFEYSASKHATYTGHSLIYPLENNITALLFEGFCYGSQPYVFTIIIVKDGKAQVVYNKPCFVAGFEAYEKGFELSLEDDCCIPRNIEKIRTTTNGGMTYEISPVVEDTTAYKYPDWDPRYPEKGMTGIREFLNANAKYPTSCVQEGIEGRVVIEFIVDTDGTITDAKVIKSVHELIDREALRVINAMPKWEPGKKNGKVVRVKKTLPIIFSPNEIRLDIY